MPYKFFRSDLGQYSILEASYRPTHFQTEFCLLCDQVSEVIYSLGNSTNVLFLQCPLHHILRYNFWGNSSHSNTIFKLQKRVIRIMMNAGIRQSCRELFRELNILPLHSQYSPYQSMQSSILTCLNSIRRYILLRLGTVQTCVYPQCICLRYKSVYTIQESTSLIIYLPE